MPKEILESVRLDRWLSAARFYKTRSQASLACEGGKVKVEGTSAKPHKMIRVGNNLTIHVHDRYRTVRVLGLAERGLPPALARELYEEIVKSPLSKEAEEMLTLYKQMERKTRRPFQGRPTKRERRTFDKFRGRTVQ